MGVSSRSKVPKLSCEPGMCSKTFSNFFIKQEIASVLPFQVFPMALALLALAPELCTKAGTWYCWTWAWHVVLELWWSWELENQDFEGQGGQPRVFIGPEECLQWQDRERWDCGGCRGGQAHLKAPRQLQPHSLPSQISISSPCTSKPLDKQHLHSLEFVLVPFFCGLGSVMLRV